MPFSVLGAAFHLSGGAQNKNQMENYYIPIEEKDPNSEIDCVNKIEKCDPTEAHELFDPAERIKLLICILISLFTLQTVNMNVTTIVPNFVSSKHDSLNELKVAFIMT